MQNAFTRTARSWRHEIVFEGGVRAVLEEASADVDRTELRRGHGAGCFPARTQVEVLDVGSEPARLLLSRDHQRRSERHCRWQVQVSCLRPSTGSMSNRILPPAYRNANTLTSPLSSHPASSSFSCSAKAATPKTSTRKKPKPFTPTPTQSFAASHKCRKSSIALKLCIRQSDRWACSWWASIPFLDWTW